MGGSGDVGGGAGGSTGRLLRDDRDRDQKELEEFRGADSGVEGAGPAEVGVEGDNECGVGVFVLDGESVCKGIGGCSISFPFALSFPLPSGLPAPNRLKGNPDPMDIPLFLEDSRFKIELFLPNFFFVPLPSQSDAVPPSASDISMSDGAGTIVDCRSLLEDRTRRRKDIDEDDEGTGVGMLGRILEELGEWSLPFVRSFGAVDCGDGGREWDEILGAGGGEGGRGELGTSAG
jgi:hypothetical protein